MGLFKSKKKKEKEKQEQESSMIDINKNIARVVVIGGVKDTPVQEESFTAKIETDNFDTVKYMVNLDKNFKELYPEKDDMYNFEVKGNSIEEKKKWLQNEIEKLNNSLTDKKQKLDKNYNEKDIDFKIKVYKTRLLELKRGIDNRGIDNIVDSPLYIGDKGLKTFFFFRTSGELIPLRWDLKGLTIYKDIAYKKKQSAIAWQNLMSKYSTKLKKTVEASLIWMMIICIIWTIALIGGSGYLFTKYQSFGDMYDQTKMAELQTQAQKSTLWCGEVLKKQLGIVENITEQNKKTLEVQNNFLTNRQEK